MEQLSQLSSQLPFRQVPFARPAIAEGIDEREQFVEHGIL